MMADDRELLRASKAWPVVEAVRLLDRVEKAPPEKGFVLFEIGYGPSGLPHIGTFEVFRTSLVRQAFRHLSDLPTRGGSRRAPSPIGRAWPSCARATASGRPQRSPPCAARRRAFRRLSMYLTRGSALAG
jgi:hypothetical protein